MSSIQSVKLKGHQGAVLCLDHSSSSPDTQATKQAACSATSVTTACLLSGSEDATARLWDLRTDCKASLCIKASGEVLSVAFGPSWEHSTGGPSSQAQSPFSRDLTVYLSTETAVQAFDLRKADSPIVSYEADWDLTPILESPDEVNQIVFSPPRRGRPLHLAAADDAGTVRVTDSFQPTKDGRPVTIANEVKRRRILYHGHYGHPAGTVATEATTGMVTSVAFRPRCKNLELASGGTDCTVQLWDINKPKRPASVLHITNSDAGANQVCNPPMVHGLEWSPSGRLLAAACGDGSVCLLQADNRSLVLAARLQEHGGAVASVIFPEWSNTNNDNLKSSHVAAHDRLLISTGNDGAIILWDLGSFLAGDGAVDPSRLLKLSSNSDDDAAADVDDGVANKLGGMSLDTDQPRVLCSIPHGSSKPNWLVSSRGRDPVYPSSIFVADTSNDITVYTIPLQ